MTDKTETQRLHRNIKSAALDLADAVLDLACHQAANAPEDQERINSARVYMHEVAGGDEPADMPKRDILFTVGAIIAGIPDNEAVVAELRASLMPALAAVLDPDKPTPTSTKALPSPCPSSRPPGVPNSTLGSFDGKFYLKTPRRSRRRRRYR